MRYKNKDGYDVVVFLGEVHNNLKERYISATSNINKDIDDANSLTWLFQTIKSYSLTKEMNNDLTPADKDFFASIYQLLPNNMQNKLLTYTGKRAGSSTKGDLFEREISTIVSAILTGSRDISNNLKAQVSRKAGVVQTGQEKAIGSVDMQRFLQENTSITVEQKITIKDGKTYTNPTKTDTQLKGMLENTAEEIQAFWLQTVPQSWKRFKELENSSQERQYGLYMTEINAKTDINAGNVQITETWHVSPKTRKAINALYGATFTAKNYNKGTNLHIGDTNAIRAYFSVLDSFGYDYITKASSFKHGINLLFSKDPSKEKRQKIYKTRIYQLRFIYELIGTGLKGSDLQELSNAKFLLYNVSNGEDIYIISTKQIIQTMYHKFEQEDFMFNRSNPFEGGMYVRLEWLNLGLRSSYIG